MPSIYCIKHFCNIAYLSLYKKKPHRKSKGKVLGERVHFKLSLKIREGSAAIKVLGSSWHGDTMYYKLEFIHDFRSFN